VSNTAGATSYDVNGKLASAVEASTGVSVLAHAVKKPGCGDEIMSYFRQHPETGVTSPHHIAIVGDRLATDMMLANMMGSWGVWVKNGVVPLERKSIVSIKWRRVASWVPLLTTSLVLQGRKKGRAVPPLSGILGTRALKSL
jgi:phosphatidylglycerophosphatase GEP4